jgi:hypothetical protein
MIDYNTFDIEDVPISIYESVRGKYKDNEIGIWEIIRCT